MVDFPRSAIIARKKADEFNEVSSRRSQGSKQKKRISRRRITIPDMAVLTILLL